MALIICPECSKSVSDKASVCPHCGYPIEQYVESLKTGKPVVEQIPAETVEPAAPAAPVNPASPVEPVSPVNLVESVAPAAPVNPVSPVASAELVAPTAKKRAWVTITIVSLVILLGIGAALYFIFPEVIGLKKNDASESEVYQKIVKFQNEKNVDSLEYYLKLYSDEYSDEIHASEVANVKALYEKEKNEWDAVSKTGSVDSIKRFIDTYRDGLFIADAKVKADDWTFEEAKRANTIEAYNEYLRNYPDGEHKTEVNRAIESLDNVKLTESEQQDAYSVVQKHFDCLASNSKGEIQSTLATDLRNYINKPDPTIEDVYAFMDKQAGKNLVFEVTNVNMKKTMAAGNVVYSMTFSLTSRKYASRSHTDFDEFEEFGDVENEPIEEKHYVGKASLNEHMKITTLTIN